MQNNARPKVQVREEDKAKSYYKYYLKDAAGIAPEKMGKVFGGPMNPMQAVPFVQRKQLQTSEGQDTEIGYCTMPDGTGYVSDVNFLPGATMEMVHWYYVWRGLDPLRYVISNPEQNMQAMTMQSEKAKDEDLSYCERYWDSTQVIMKMTEMGPSTEFVNFKCPSAVGFDMESDTADTSSLICGRGYAQGEPPTAQPDYFVCHQLCEKEGGIEVRSKYWLGWTVRYGKDYKELQDDFWMPPMMAFGVLMQNMQEWANLATILPQLYEEEKDHFEGRK